MRGPFKGHGAITELRWISALIIASVDPRPSRPKSLTQQHSVKAWRKANYECKDVQSRLLYILAYIERKRLDNLKTISVYDLRH